MHANFINVDDLKKLNLNLSVDERDVEEEMYYQNLMQNNPSCEVVEEYIE
jgi:hypothetical protein